VLDDGVRNPAVNRPRSGIAFPRSATSSQISALAASEKKVRYDASVAPTWVRDDEALINAGRALPIGRVGRLTELINERDEEQEEE